MSHIGGRKGIAWIGKQIQKPVTQAIKRGVGRSIPIAYTELTK